MAQSYSPQELDRLLTSSKEADKKLFAEMRNNLMLVAGQHYAKQGWKEFEGKVRGSDSVTPEQRVRLTMNHVQKIIKRYEENVFTMAPGAHAVPQNDKELQDRKSAELNNSVLSAIKQSTNHKEELLSDLEDFFRIGEVACKVFWDEHAGKYMGTQPELDENGMMAVDEEGNPKQAIPKFSGELKFERIYGFNLLRPKEAQTRGECAWLGIEKMVNITTLKKKLQAEGKEDLAKKIDVNNKKTFVVFNNVDGSYTDSKDEVMVREIYFKPCMAYPEGYFFYMYEELVLWEGILPHGIFPIIWEGAENIQTTPRSFSPIRHMRPYQAEINRSASKIAEHQITLGDDKLVTFSGSKLSKGSDLPGVRHIIVSGNQEPTVMAGRSGEQYLSVMQSKIDELYMVMDVEADGLEKAQQDPQALLFASMKRKKKFSKFATRFENFLINKYQTALDIFRKSAPDDYVVNVIGKQEQINMAELRASGLELGSRITLEPASDDVDALYGKQMVLGNIIQYLGGNLPQEDLGKIVRAMPLLEGEEALSDLTMNYDIATNVMLALDRGETPPMGEYEDHIYMVKKLTHRMSQADFTLLAPEIQNNYKTRVLQHQQVNEQMQQQLAQMNAGLIPTSGPLIGVDFYVTDPQNQTRTRRARIPMDAVRDLINKLEQQGTTVQQLESLPEAERAKLGQQQAQASAGGQDGSNGQQQPAVAVADPGAVAAANGAGAGGEFTGAVTGEPGAVAPVG